jgi:hypothetical protein
MKEKQLPLVNREQGVRLRRLGFDYPTLYCYDNQQLCSCVTPEDHNLLVSERVVSAPTVALALQWMQDEKGISCGVYPVLYTTHNQGSIPDRKNCYYEWLIWNKSVYIDSNKSKYPAFNDASSALLDACINIIVK